jgi:hypothetical protein
VSISESTLVFDSLTIIALGNQNNWEEIDTLNKSMIQRIAVLKYRFNDNIGKFNELCIKIIKK